MLPQDVESRTPIAPPSYFPNRDDWARYFRMPTDTFRQDYVPDAVYSPEGLKLESSAILARLSRLGEIFQSYAQDPQESKVRNFVVTNWVRIQDLVSVINKEVGAAESVMKGETTATYEEYCFNQCLQTAAMVMLKEHLDKQACIADVLGKDILHVLKESAEIVDYAIAGELTVKVRGITLTNILNPRYTATPTGLANYYRFTVATMSMWPGETQEQVVAENQDRLQTQYPNVTRERVDSLKAKVAGLRFAPRDRIIDYIKQSKGLEKEVGLRALRLHDYFADLDQRTNHAVLNPTSAAHTAVNETFFELLHQNPRTRINALYMAGFHDRESLYTMHRRLDATPAEQRTEALETILFELEIFAALLFGKEEVISREGLDLIIDPEKTFSPDTIPTAKTFERTVKDITKKTSCRTFVIDPLTVDTGALYTPISIQIDMSSGNQREFMTIVKFSPNQEDTITIALVCDIRNASIYWSALPAECTEPDIHASFSRLIESALQQVQQEIDAQNQKAESKPAPSIRRNTEYSPPSNGKIKEKPRLKPKTPLPIQTVIERTSYEIIDHIEYDETEVIAMLEDNETASVDIPRILQGLREFNERHKGTIERLRNKHNDRPCYELRLPASVPGDARGLLYAIKKEKGRRTFSIFDAGYRTYIFNKNGLKFK